MDEMMAEGDRHDLALDEVMAPFSALGCRAGLSSACFVGMGSHFGSMGICRDRRLLARLSLALLAFTACNGRTQSDGSRGPVSGSPATGGGGGASAAGGTAANGGDMTVAGGTLGSGSAAGSGISVDAGIVDPKDECPVTTCAELGVECGKVVDNCGNVTDCALEGFSCAPDQACTGGIDRPAQCMAGGSCEVCHAVRDCSAAAQETALAGRVITPGRDDTDASNQLGVPNALVYILRTKGVAGLPPITAGIPAGGTSCDRCEDQDLGPVLIGTVTDATGAFTLSGGVPIGEEFTLVVKAGRFRRAIAYTVPEAGACTTTSLPTALPENPTRLPRGMDDGMAASIPRIAVSTGEVDAMECVLEKMGLAVQEFGNPGASGDGAQRVHLYRGGPANGPSGARVDDATPHASVLYSDPLRLAKYDIVLSDCEGGGYDGQFAERKADGPNVADYVNRGGRLFASHLSFTWLHGNGTEPYDPANPAATGLAAAATWDTTLDGASNAGTGVVATGRPLASARIHDFAAWMDQEMVAPAPAYTFGIIEPRSQAMALGPASEEFVFNSDVTRTVNIMGMTIDETVPDDRSQQFSFDTPYAAPRDAVCGRVAYSGFHVSADAGNTAALPFEDAIFPEHCAGNLTSQEKVLLYMLFDLSACVGDTPPPPRCMPSTCDSLGLECGFSGDGCGGVLDCGACPLPNPK